MDTTIDNLQIEISATGESASRGLGELKASLEKLKAATRGGLGLSGIVKNLKAMAQMSDAQSTTEKINALSTSLSNLGKATSGLKISSSIASQIKSIAEAAGGTTGMSFSAINDLSSALNSLRFASGMKISSTIAKQIREISSAANSIRGTDFSVLREVGASLQPLAALGKSNLSSYVTQLAKIPQVVSSLDDGTLDEFTSKMERLAAALSPLSDQLNRVGSAFSRFPQNVRAANGAVNTIPAANSMAIASYKDFSAMIHDAARAVRGAASAVAGWIKNSNDYIENLNLFTVSLGKYAGEAENFADKVADTMGIDPSEWMRDQGIFYSLADGFGVVSDRAYLMSKNLTQLGYDISSFFNIPIAESMQKLQSGISGEIEPLRRLGYDLSQTKLQTIAASLGIQKAVSNMNQAEKAQLRYYAIMTQVTNAQGDMARTLNSPSNQLRILSASATQAARALGNIFIPVMNTVLPAAIAVAKGIRAVAVSIATLFGYSLPSVDFSVTTGSIDGVGDSMDNVAEGADKAGSAAKKLKSILMGFDEINQLPDPSGGGGGGGGSGGGSLSGFEFELPEYDFLADMVSSQVDAIYSKVQPFITWVEDHLTGILAIGASIAGALLSWKLAKSFLPDISKGLSTLKMIGGFAAALATVAITVSLVYAFDTEFAESGNPGLLIADGLTTLLGGAIVGKVVQHAFGMNSLYGAAITVGISALTTINALHSRAEVTGKFDGRTIALGITGLVKGALSGAAVGFALGGPVGAGVGAAIGAVITIGVELVAVYRGFAQKNIKDQVQWGTLEVAAENVRKYALSLFEIDADANIKLVSATLENESLARDKLDSSIAHFGSTLNLIQIGAAVNNSSEVLATLQSQASALVSDLTTMLQTQNETVKVGLHLIPAQNDEGDDISASLLTSFTSASNTLTAGVSELGAQLSAAIADGMVDGMSAEEQRIITELSASLSRISIAVETGKVQGEFAAKTGILLSDLTESSFESVAEEYNLIRAELEKSYEGIQIQARAGVEGQLAGLKEYLTTIDQASDPQKYAEIAAQITSLETELNNWDFELSVDDALENAIGPAKQKWVEAIQSMFSDSFGEIDASGVDMSGFTRSWIGSLADGADFTDFATAFETKIFDVYATSFGSAQEAAYVLNIADQVGITGWELLGTDVQTQLYNMMVAATSVEEVNELFNALGYSIPGAVEAGLESAGGLTVTPSVETQTVVEQLQEVAETASSTGVAVDGISDGFAGTGKTASDELGKAATAASDATEAIAATGAQAETVATKIVEIPTGKVIAIEISGYTTIIRNLNNIREKITSLSSKTINLKVKAGLTSGAKAFLKALKLIDTSIGTTVDAVINASQFAGGGYPRSGELFIANEAGAEMVGRIGNRTAVANQDQIGDAIFQYMDAHSSGDGIDEERLATVMVSAMRAAGIGAVNIDGRSITQAINRESQRMGKPAVR